MDTLCKKYLGKRVSFELNGCGCIGEVIEVVCSVCCNDCIVAEFRSNEGLQVKVCGSYKAFTLIKRKR